MKNAENRCYPLGNVKYSLQKGPRVLMSGAMPGQHQEHACNVEAVFGEISRAALLIRWLYMLWRKVFTWHMSAVAFSGSYSYSRSVLSR